MSGEIIRDPAAEIRRYRRAVAGEQVSPPVPTTDPAAFSTTLVPRDDGTTGVIYHIVQAPRPTPQPQPNTPPEEQNAA